MNDEQKTTSEQEKPKPATERVLCFPAHVLDTLGRFQGALKLDLAGRYLEEIFHPDNLYYVDRDDAENDPSHKQIIPYTVLMRGKEAFSYRRTTKGGESRLHEQYSVGLGGHINPCDGREHEAYDSAFFRELQEEVSLKLDGDRVTVAPVIGLLNDDSNDVGKVHFGIVHLVRVSFQTHMEFHDPAVENGDWHHLLDLKSRRELFENWSRLVLEELL